MGVMVVMGKTGMQGQLLGCSWSNNRRATFSRCPKTGSETL
jgi:hypothetical protein